MTKKVFSIFCFFLIFLSFIFIMSTPIVEENEVSFYISNIEEKSIEDLLMIGFESNDNITVGQLIIFFNRYLGNNVHTFQEAVNFCEYRNIFLPSDLVYSVEEWESLWKDIVLGNAIFEKVNDNTYSITLIQGYFKIYLNQEGYEFVKKGLIPPQLYFYSPFSKISNLESINFNKPANLGFVLEILMNLEYEGKAREQLLRTLVIQKVEELTGILEDDWGTSEINLYNYYSLSYFGEFTYFKSKGLLEQIDLKNLTNPISTVDFLALFNMIIK